MGVYREALAVVTSRLMDDRQLAQEYKAVLRLDQQIDHTVHDSQLSENVPRNRYINVLPFDYNRVRLVSGAEAVSTSGYVNASLVRYNDRSSGQHFSYVATQGPLQTTVADFWRMVVEARVPAIVMLTNVTERGAIKCYQYYPESVGQRLQPSPDIEVVTTAVSTRSGGQMTVRTLTVNMHGHPALQVDQFCYHAWPDHGTPDESLAIRGVCELLQGGRERLGSGRLTSTGLFVIEPMSVETPSAATAATTLPCHQQPGSAAHAPQASPAAAAATAAAITAATGTPGSAFATTPQTPNTATPATLATAPQAIVHCSAGIGRTGTFIAVDILRQRLHKLAVRAASSPLEGAALSRELQDALNLPALVHELRQQRMGMVQTFEQYAFIYQVRRLLGWVWGWAGCQVGLRCGHSKWETDAPCVWM
jgi:tyrosine-protein phosphatase non-receptor type 9